MSVSPPSPITFEILKYFCLEFKKFKIFLQYRHYSISIARTWSIILSMFLNNGSIVGRVSCPKNWHLKIGKTTTENWFRNTQASIKFRRSGHLTVTISCSNYITSVLLIIFNLRKRLGRKMERLQFLNVIHQLSASIIRTDGTRKLKHKMFILLAIQIKQRKPWKCCIQISTPKMYTTWRKISELLKKGPQLLKIINF